MKATPSKAETVIPDTAAASPTSSTGSTDNENETIITTTTTTPTSSGALLPTPPTESYPAHPDHDHLEIDMVKMMTATMTSASSPSTFASSPGPSSSSSSILDEDEHHPHHHSHHHHHHHHVHPSSRSHTPQEKEQQQQQQQQQQSRSPILPVRVDLINLGYKPKNTPKAPRILQEVNATFEPGQFVAVMGPSGSGKSSLLRLIQGDHRYLRGLEGEALANGTSIKAIHHAWRYLCSLVPQEDVLLGSFTVRETLSFSTHLRLPKTKTTVAEKEAIVHDVLEDLGITECQDVLIKDISGGQRRRVSVGLELLVNPSVLLLDEPTSGLDSKTAEDICHLLHRLARPGRLVMTSIHQPSYKIFSSFSKLCFLAKGRLVYTGAFSSAMPYFEGLGFKVPTYDSPADYYMRVMQTDGPLLIAAWGKVVGGVGGVGGGEGGKEGVEIVHVPVPVVGGKEGVEDGVELVETPTTVSSTISPPPKPRTLTTTSTSSSSSSSPSSTSSTTIPPSAAWDPTGKWLTSTNAKKIHTHTHVSNWHQYRMLLRRFLQDSYKDTGKMLSGILMEGTIGLMIGLVWFQQNIHEEASVFPIMGVFIMLTTIAVFDNCVSVALKFPLTRALHFREYSNGYYRLVPYYFATVTSSLILSSIYQLIQALLVFFLVGLDFTLKKFSVYLCVLALAGSMGAFLGFIVGTFTSDLKRTQEVLTPLLMPMLIFSGYMLPLPQIPKYLRFMYYSSFYQYTFSSLTINHFSGLAFDDCSVLNVFCLRKGDEYLKVVGLEPEMLGRNVGVCVGFLLLFIGVGFWSLRRVSLY